MAKKKTTKKSAATKRRAPENAPSSLREYNRKRDFLRTPEPSGTVPPVASDQPSGRLFAIQKHSARNLHYDLRLEFDGVLLSWAIPKGPSLDPTVKSLAVRTEDHPLEYADFEGIIPKGEYGAGTVMLWDTGEWEPINEPRKALEKGDLKFRLYAEKLGGAWALVRIGPTTDSRDWLLIKKKDDAARARATFNVLNEQPRSVATDRTLEQIAADADTSWDNKNSVSRRSVAATKRAPKRPSRLDPSTVPGAREAAQPTAFKPQLATASKAAPLGEDWVHEAKYDGYRLICMLENGVPKLLTRNGHNWTDRFPNLLPVIARLPIGSAILDGEVTVLDHAGIPDFGALQNAFRRRDRAGFVYYLFDVMHASGHDLTGAPLLDRKTYLKRLLDATPDAGPALRFSDHIVGRGPTVAREAAKHAMEGIVSKRADAKYTQRRSDSWLKVKFKNREEFVITGYTKPDGARSGFGALLVARYDQAGRLFYCGRVGTGFSQRTLDQLGARLRTMHRATPPVANTPSGADAKGVQWLTPTLVCEVEFGAWTHDAMLRHPAFIGLREDKPAHQVIGATPKHPKHGAHHKPPPVVKLAKGPGDQTIGGIRISSPDRTVYPETGHTKADVARFYDAAAEWILPHIANRPLSIVRCPEGVEGEHFFQKHVGEGFPNPIHGTPISERDAKHPYLSITNRDGLLSLAQMGVLEIHSWGAHKDKPDHPDTIVFDLDPGPGITWEHIVESAKFVRDYLARIDLKSFAKTSGGSGIHVVVPLTRRAGWDDIKAFAHAVAKDIVRIAPQNFVATMAKTHRENRIFIDYLRNTKGATAVAPYSTRALPLATVSTPLRWKEVSNAITPRDLNITTVTRRLARLRSDPWEGYFDTRQSITKEIRRALGLEV